jgi:copper chaperone CopZ
MEPSDPHDLRNTEEAAIETAHLEIEGSGEQDSVTKAIGVLKKVEGVREVHGENASGIVTVTFDARVTHVPALHDALLRGGYHPARNARD